MKATQMPQLEALSLGNDLCCGLGIILFSRSMEGKTCSSNAHQGDSSGGSRDAGENSLTGKEAYVNHAEIAWNQMRNEWVGDRSKKIQRPPEASTICLTASSDHMLFSGEPFHPPIPLPVMVDYLVKMWDDEGLFEIANSTNKLNSTFRLPQRRFLSRL
ncbi:hypothetical protein P8452_67214 [Trifolium repens]|nr:hypothetical protein P8452_67214 [Trifolium repens]